MDSTTYRDLISPWLDDPAIAGQLSQIEIQDLTDRMALYYEEARARIMLEDPTKPAKLVAQQALDQTLYDVFLIPILGVEPVDAEPETIPLLTPAQLLQRIIREERDAPLPC